MQPIQDGVHPLPSGRRKKDGRNPRVFPEGLPPLRSRMRHSPHGKKQILLADRSRGWMVDNRFCNKIRPASGDIHLATGQFLIHFCNSQRKRRALPEQLMDRSRDHRRSIAVGHLGFIDPACGTGQRVSGRCSNLDLLWPRRILHRILIARHLRICRNTQHTHQAGWNGIRIPVAVGRNHHLVPPNQPCKDGTKQLIVRG